MGPPRLGLHDVGARDLVVPALLVRVEGDPDDADEDDDAAQDEADVADERIHERELGTGGLHDADPEDPAARGLPVAVRRPEVEVVGETEERREAIPSDGVTAEDEPVQDARDDGHGYTVDHDRGQAPPETGL